MSHHVSAQLLGQVSSNPVQFLWSRHGVEGELLHVRLTEAILETTTQSGFRGFKQSLLKLSSVNTDALTDQMMHFVI